MIGNGQTAFTLKFCDLLADMRSWKEDRLLAVSTPWASGLRQIQDMVDENQN
jgi:hypothetical protein